MPMMVSQRIGAIAFFGVSDMAPHRILILGGTTEARELAERLAQTTYDVTVSLAGRTLEPRPLPVPVRTGGFGGNEGLARYLTENRIDLLVDATHPFATQISHNAVHAASAAAVPVFALCRPPWNRTPDDRWTAAATIDAAVAALGRNPRRVFLSIGRQEAYRFSTAPQHAYLVRSVDPVDPPLSVPDCRYLLSTGPFDVEAERRLLADNAIDAIVTKNSGGTATYAKIEAARALGIEVIMIERQPPQGLVTVADAEAALAIIDHCLGPV
jgi:precorrin-6A/cobalt-precorrin-6A reductase